MSKVFTYHEVCMYAYEVDSEGNYIAADSVSPALSVRGWNVYVRGYEYPDAETWEELHDKYFDTEAEASIQAEEWATKYNCGVDSY